MRKQLKELGNDKRHTFTARVSRFGERSAFKGAPIRTILLADVRCEGKEMTDHLWMDFGKQMARANLVEGDNIQFDARVSSYWKGYVGHDEYAAIEHPVSEDYRLSYPTNVSKIV